MLLAVLLSGCNAGSRAARDKGLVLSTDMQLRSYVQSAVGPMAAGKRASTFPYFRFTMHPGRWCT